MSERRKHLRIHTIADIEILAGGKTTKGVITNISASGLGIIITAPIQIGERVEISFNLAKESKFTGIKGTVVRADHISDQFYYFLGVNFQSIKEDKKAELNRFVLDKKIEHYGIKMKD